MKIIYSNMFYAKIFHLLSVSASKFPNIIDKISSFKAHFRLYIKQRSNFEKIIKYLSTFYIRFKRTVSNQRNVHRRFPTTSWIEDRSVLTCARAPLPKNFTKLPKNYDIHSDPREIDQWSYEWKCFSAWLVVRHRDGVLHLHFDSISLFRFIFMHWLVIVYIFCHVEK